VSPFEGSEPPAEDPAERWVLLLQRGTEEVLYEAAAMTAAAASLGITVTLVWFDAALEALVSGRLEETEGEASAARLLSAARETGRVRSLACSASMIRARLEPERVREKVDDVVGWPTAVSLIRSAKKAFVW
jgi:predicted peroxiredoxin